MAVKLTWGINTRNRDNDVRSGNWIGVENALAYKSAIGVFGLHTVFVQQGRRLHADSDHQGVLKPTPNIAPQDCEAIRHRRARRPGVRTLARIAAPPLLTQ